MRMSDAMYMMGTTSIKSSEIKIKDWLFTKDDAVEFLINEYHSALGSEKVKSKFFHLFAMIEFVEKEYADQNPRW